MHISLRRARRPDLCLPSIQFASWLDSAASPFEDSLYFQHSVPVSPHPTNPIITITKLSTCSAYYPPNPRPNPPAAHNLGPQHSPGNRLRRPIVRSCSYKYT